METEDDMIVLVVVDDEEKTKLTNFHLPEIKQEPEGFPEETHMLNDVIESMDKQDDSMSIKIEPEDYQLDYLEDEMLQRVLTEQDIQYEDNDMSEDYIPDHDQQKTNKHRFTMLKPWQQRSFVAELRQEYEELRDDEELLINTLEQIMRSVKPPPPPHDFYIMNGIMFECIHCGSLSETIPAAGRHYQEKHGQRYLVCYACGVDFRSTTNLYKHEKRCVAPDADVVLKARAACVGRKGRSRPYLSVKSRNSKSDRARFPCQLCSAVFMTRSNLQSHENLHRGERPFRCHACPCAYTSYSALSRHTKKHMDIQFTCDHCNRSFKIKAALVSHMDTHKPVRKHGCIECSRRFAQKSALMLHINRVHRNLPPPCACRICPKRYPRMSLLKAHMKRAHGMSIITRKMFFKSLPTMSELEVKQSKVILKSDGDNFDYTTLFKTEESQGYTQEEDNDNEEHDQDIDCLKIAEQMIQQSEQEMDEQNSVNSVQISEEQEQSDISECVKIEIPEGSASVGEFLQYIQNVNECPSGSVSDFVQYVHKACEIGNGLGSNVIYIENGEVAVQHVVGSSQENLVLEVEAIIERDGYMVQNLNGDNTGDIVALVKTEDLG